MYQCDSSSWTCSEATIGNYSTSASCEANCVKPLPLCNGKADPASCETESKSLCNDKFSGPPIRKTCPVLCNTCRSPSRSPTLPAVAIAAGGGGGLLLLLLLGGLYRRSRTARRRTARRLPGADNDDDDVLLLQPMYQEYFEPDLTLPRAAVTLGPVIGSGNFGKVYSGTVQPERGPASPAAIKSPSHEARAEFELEMQIMSKIEAAGGHHHIVKVLGCVYGPDPLLVLELCGRGSLQSVLAACRANPPPSQQLTSCGYHVALAMTFLESNSLLHRDIAARNVLVTDGLVCKLADFGLSRSVGNKKTQNFFIK